MMPARSIPAFPALGAFLALTACGSDVEYFADDGDGWRGIDRAEYEAWQAGGTPVADAAGSEAAIRAALARDPMGTVGPAQPDPAPGMASSTAVADASLAATREICNIPPGVEITPETPCNF